MEIQQSKCWEGSMHFYIERTGFTSKFSMLLTDSSCNLLSRDACYTLGVLKPCYTVEKQLGINENSTHSTQPQVTPIHSSKLSSKVGNSFLHQEMKGTVRKLSNNSTQHSISKEQLQGIPLTKHDILETYADVFTRNGKFPG